MPAFTCPRCGSNAWGSSGAHDLSIATVDCHIDTITGAGGCGFSGRYVDHIHEEAPVSDSDDYTRFPRETAQRKLAAYDDHVEAARVARGERWFLAAIGFMVAMIASLAVILGRLLQARYGLVLLVALALLPGCFHTISDVAVSEMETAASSGEGTLRDWSALTDDQRRESVFKLARAERSGLSSIRGDPMPDLYKVDPWAPKVDAAPVSSSR